PETAPRPADGPPARDAGALLGRPAPQAADLHARRRRHPPGGGRGPGGAPGAGGVGGGLIRPRRPPVVARRETAAGAPDRPKGPERLLRPLRVVRVGRGCAARAASSRSCVRAGQAAAGVVARSWRRVTTSVSCSTTSESSAGCSSAKRVTEPGMDSLMSSTTVPPAMPTALRASSCAHTPPYWPKAVPTTATGLPEMAPAPIGRDSQSMAFFRTAGMVPLYSGV